MDACQQDIYFGAINFFGGWLGEDCGDFQVVNQSLFVSGSAYSHPALWLYGANDSFYSIDHSQSNFDAYVSAGDLAEFHILVRSADRNGHFVLNGQEHWGPIFADYVAEL